MKARTGGETAAMIVMSLDRWVASSGKARLGWVIIISGTSRSSCQHKKGSSVMRARCLF